MKGFDATPAGKKVLQRTKKKAEHLDQLYDLAVKSLGYKCRDVQRRMLHDLFNTITKPGGHPFIAEAATGTGKSLVLGIAAIHCSQELGKKVVISTARRDLQHDLLKLFQGNKLSQGLIAAIGKGETVAVLKGKANYLSLRKLEYLQSLTGTDESFTACVELLDVLAQRYAGDLDEILENEGMKSLLVILDPEQQFMLSPDELGIRGTKKKAMSPEMDRQLSLSLEDEAALIEPIEVSAGPDTIFYDQAKITAADADIVITNHAMLAVQTVIFSKAGPVYFDPADTVVLVDEAHKFPEAVCSFLSSKVSMHLVKQYLDRLIVDVQHKPIVAKMLKLRKKISLIENLLVSDLDSKCGGTLMVKRLYATTGEQHLMDKVMAAGISIHADLSRVVKALTKSGAPGDIYHPVHFLSEQSANLGVYIKKMGDIQNNISPSGIDGCFVVSHTPTLKSLSFEKEVVNAGGIIRRNLLDFLPQSAFVSGTLVDYGSLLATTDSATYQTLQYRTGMSIPIKKGKGKGRVISPITKKYASPFNWKKQVHIYIDGGAVVNFTDDVAQNKAERERHCERVGRLLANTIEKTAKGGVVVLAPSYEDIPLIREHYRKNGGRKITHEGKKGYPLAALQKKYKSDSRNAIMLSASGWEGIDLPGDLLTDLVITRLPFENPRGARALAKKEAGESYLNFLADVVAVLRQGIGRLIRGETDSGNIYICDSRILTKPGMSTLRTYLETMYTVHVIGVDTKPTVSRLRKPLPGKKPVSANV